MALCLSLLGCKRESPVREEGVGAATEHQGHDGTSPAPERGHPGPPATSSVPGYAPVTLDPARLGALSIATSPAGEQPFTRTIRTTGIVTIDETRTSHVHAKVRGVIEAVHVDFVGREVREGEPLCSLYSQEVHGAELEFLSILERAGAIPRATGEFAQAERDAEAQLLAAARRRLSLWDVPASEIARLEATREVKRTFPILAGRRGVVVAKQAIAGTYIDPSIELYTISDLSNVWVLADVYEADARSVTVGQEARIAVQGEGAARVAKVSFLPPTLDEATRTLKARLDVPNKDRRLRPGAFAEVVMDLAVARGLGVPASAVVRTGTRSIVFVVHGPHVEPREVTIGALVGDRYEIASGLRPGEQVATGAQFLLDSESRLQATTSGGGGHAAHGH